MIVFIFILYNLRKKLKIIKIVKNWLKLFIGSLTDSICTAYENKVVKSMNIDAKSHSSDDEKEIAFAPMTGLTSMLGGKVNKFWYIIAWHC